MDDLDAVDLLDGLDGLAHDPFQPLDQLHAQPRLTGIVGEHVLGLVAQPFGFRAHGSVERLRFGRTLVCDGGEPRFALGTLDAARGEDALLRAHGGGQLLVGLDAGGRFLGRLGKHLYARFQFEQLDRLGAFQLQAPEVLLAGDAGLVGFALGGEASAFRFLRGLDLGLFGRTARRDPFGIRAGFRGDARLCGLCLALGLHLRHGRSLLRARGLDVLFLLQPSHLGLALQGQRLTLGFQVALANGDDGALLDVVADLAALLDDLDELGQTFGVEAVGRVEMLQISLVEIADGDRMKLQPVARDGGAGPLAHRFHESCPILVNVVEGHLRGDCAHGADELALEEAGQPLGLRRHLAQARRGGGHGLARRSDAQEELGIGVHPHPVAGDERVLALGRHAQPREVERDGRDLVDDRQHERAAGDDDLLAAHAGAHEGALGGRALVEPVEQPNDDRHRNEGDDEECDELAHVAAPSGAGILMRLNFSVCSRSAISVGSRSMEDAP